MQNMSRLHTKGYIFPSTIRKYYKFCGIPTSLGLLCFALFMLGVGLKQNSDRIPCFVVASIFGVIHIGYTIIWIRNYHLINATYIVNDYAASNCVNKMNTETSVKLSSATKSDYTYSFHFGYASFEVDFFIYSDTILSDSIVDNIEGDNIYKATRKIWGSGSVIVPKSD